VASSRWEKLLPSIQVDGEYALIVWRLRFEGGEFPFGTDTFHVQNGKIVAQTGAFHLG